MSENSPSGSAPAPAPATPAVSAGGLLKAARLRQGLDLEQLALQLKVTVRKLEALESDRLSELPGLAFARGLATSVARQLGVDPQQVLDALPAPDGAPKALEHVTRGLAQPYREHGSGINWPRWPDWVRPQWALPGLLLVLALALWLLPQWPSSESADAAAVPLTSQAASAVSEILKPVLPAEASASAVPNADGVAAGGASAVIETVHSTPVEDASASAPGAAGTVVLRISAESWIEARDATGAVLLSRMLLPGEVLGLEGVLPIKLKIGNANGTRLALRGQAVDLTPFTRDNVARVELK